MLNRRDQQNNKSGVKKSTIEQRLAFAISASFGAIMLSLMFTFVKGYFL